MKNKNRTNKVILLIMIVANLGALLLSIMYYFKFSDLYESQVDQMKNTYLGLVADMLTKETEIKNIFLFCKILMAFFFVNLSASIFLYVRIRRIKEKL
jgi:Na+-transporting NADH:ubiquinone oxidoreductase subunit NqrC